MRTGDEMKSFMSPMSPTSLTRMFAAAIALLLSMAAAAQAHEWKAPTTMKRLPNGLTVVVAEDHSAPTFGLCITYGIGSRLEPVGRTGFAHLFEHMMFEGTPVAPKGIFDRVIESGGGVLNGQTWNDFTQYVESAPLPALEPVLWLEADRMTTLDFSTKNLDNQRAVVEEEVRVNVLNQPYGQFWTNDLPGKAFDTYPNSHDGYGDFKDLDAANIGDVQRFYEQYYAPNNAVLALVGDIKTDEAFALVEKYFAGVHMKATPPRPDVSEPPQTAERRLEKPDKLAKVPALAVGYRMPAHATHDAVVAAVTGELLHNGEASILYQSLVKEKELALSVNGGLNFSDGSPFEYNGPTLMVSLVTYPPDKTEEQVLAGYDADIEYLAKKGPSPAQLERIRSKMRSDWYGQLEIPVNLASALAHATVLDGKFERVYSIPDEVGKVSAEEVRAFAAKYLVRSNRTIANRVPSKGENPATGGGTK